MTAQGTDMLRVSYIVSNDLVKVCNILNDELSRDLTQRYNLSGLIPSTFEQEPLDSCSQLGEVLRAPLASTSARRTPNSSRY